MQGGARARKGKQGLDAQRSQTTAKQHRFEESKLRINSVKFCNSVEDLKNANLEFIEVGESFMGVHQFENLYFLCTKKVAQSNVYTHNMKQIKA